MKVLVTGGCGYIGSHTVCELLKEEMEVVILDNLTNSHSKILKNIEDLTGKKVTFYQGDVASKELLHHIFEREKIEGVIHFAGYKAVSESVKNPLKYYQNNLESTIHLLEVMQEENIKNFIFSSSATVYGNPTSLPITENATLQTTNPYGTTKLMIEKILKDLYQSDPTWNITILRYFNPIGNEPSGMLGENPKGTPNNLMPYLVRVATGKLPVLNIFGQDYPTVDGTGVRDYIHVVDLARGHVLAFKKLKGLSIYNLGTGVGTSVLELVKAFEKVNHLTIPYNIVKRRDGDIAACYASVSKAKEELGFETEKTIEDMCKDSYTYIKQQEEDL